MDFKNTKISTSRSLLDYSKVQPVVSIILRGRKFQSRRAILTGKRLLNIGCGPNIEEKFINLDYNWRQGVDICTDLTNGIPLPDSYVEGIFSEHCFEHLSFSLVKQVLNECYRVMSKGGYIRLVVPDAELYINKYKEIQSGKIVDFPYVTADQIQSGEITAMMAINTMFRGHGHLFAYDFDTLKKLLAESGFSDIQRKEFQKGSATSLLIDTSSRACESLYVEAVKI